MKIFSVKVIEEYYSPPEVEVLDKWLEDNDFKEFKSNSTPFLKVLNNENDEFVKLPYKYSQEYTIASGLWYLRNNYPKSKDIDIFYFAYLISIFTNDVSNLTFITDYLFGDLTGIRMILALAGGEMNYDGVGYMLPEEQLKNKKLKEFTKESLKILTMYYFEDRKKAINKMINENNIEIGGIIALSLKATEDNYFILYNIIKNLLNNKTIKEEVVKGILTDFMNGAINISVGKL